MANQSDWIFEVTEAEFDEKVIKKSHEVAVVVDFWAPWCGPCRSLTPILERMIQKQNGKVVLAKVNTDDEQNLAMQFGISGIPHVIGFRKGNAVVQFTGLLPEEQMQEFFDRLEPTAAEKEADAAAQLEKTDPAEAEKRYRQALKEDPNQESAMVGLARVLLDLNKHAEVSDLLEPIGPHSAFAAEAEKLRAMVWLKEQAKDLADEATLRQKTAANPENADALCDLGCVLAANGKSAEALESLFQAGSLDRKLVSTRVKETMVKIFFVVGARSELADTYRDKLTKILY
jgi:putative thioredoxin